MVKAVFTGSTTFSEGFSSLLDSPTADGGCHDLGTGQGGRRLLLHAPVEGMTEAAAQGAKILGISLLTALALSVLLSAVLALAFQKPLQKMKTPRCGWRREIIRPKTGVKQTDEIGELAAASTCSAERLDAANGRAKGSIMLRRDFVANISTSSERRSP